MSCYFRHMRDVFDEAGVTVTKENKKALDAAIHAAAGVEYKDCPAAWRAVKAMLGEPRGRAKLIEAVRKA